MMSEGLKLLFAPSLAPTLFLDDQGNPNPAISFSERESAVNCDCHPVAHPTASARFLNVPKTYLNLLVNKGTHQKKSPDSGFLADNNYGSPCLGVALNTLALTPSY